MADAPKRACRFVLDLEADTRDDLATALFNIASQIERGELSQGVSGGYSSGYIYELSENDHPTHTEWAQQLRAYLDTKQAPPGVPAVVPAHTGPANRRVYVTCHQCDNCQHIGINDEHPTESACNRGICGWHGPSPAEDKCPGCGEVGTMSTACPECGGHYVLLADERIPAGVQAAPKCATCNDTGRVRTAPKLDNYCPDCRGPGGVKGT